MYECAVPVIAAVNGFCVGGGVGLVGNADIVVASDDAYFGVPEVNQGALGAATHMARLVPQQMMRSLYFTAATIPASELHRFRSVYRLVPRDELHATALAFDPPTPATIRSLASPSAAAGRIRFRCAKPARALNMTCSAPAPPDHPHATI